MDYKGDIYYIKQIIDGQANAFSVLVNRHKNHVYNLAFRICGNHEESEEIAQDSFMKAYRSLKGFKMKSSFSTWLYRIVYNTAISFVRSKKKGILSIDDFPADATDFIGTVSDEEDIEKEFRKSIINFALQKLKDEDRALITLYYYEDFSIEEIADITSYSKSNVKIRLFRARNQMQEIIIKAEKKNTIYHE